MEKTKYYIAIKNMKEMDYIMGNKKIRTEKEIKKYMDEAFDKVWFMRSHPCDIPNIEKGRLKSIKRVEKEYPEVKKVLIIGSVVLEWCVRYTSLGSW